MKRVLIVALAVVMALGLFACAGDEGGSNKGNVDVDKKSEGVMTYAEYAAADMDAQVVIEAYVQGKQSWWNDQATVYLQDGTGAYFCYNMACPEADYAKLVDGQKIKVTGYKGSWAGEIEIMDASFVIEDGNYIAPATDVTSLVGTSGLVDKQNMKVAFKGMTVEAYNGQGGKGFAYKNDEPGDDLYFQASVNGTTIEFCVEYYLTNDSTDVYKAVEALQVGQTIDVEGFLYWYEGANPHVTSVIVK